MFFSRLGKFLAYCGFAFGAALVGIGLYAAQTGLVIDRYFPAKTPAQLVDDGAYWLLLSIALGILAEIALTSRR